MRPIWNVIFSSVLVAILLWPTVVSAQDRITVAPDQSVIVVKKIQAITNEKATLGVVAKVTQGSGPQATNVLIYLPPLGAKDAEDTVQYTADGQTIMVPISVKPAAPQLNDAQFYTNSFKALFALFIVAVVVESGLALLFNWRPYLDVFIGRSINPPVAFAFSFFFVWLFDLDITTSLMNTYSGTKYAANLPGMALTAMIVAGGSSGVNRIFQTFGFRAPSAQPVQSPKAPPTEAWLSVTCRRDKSVGLVDVVIVPVGAAAGQPVLAGTVGGRQQPLAAWFLKSESRFPPTGGHVIVPGTAVEVMLRGRDKTGATLSSSTWGPCQLTAGAIVDIELTL
jgi:hypothetical protein